MAIWHTSDNKEAVRSRISLWRIVGKPPKLHVIAWSTENDIPQVQDDDTFERLQSYLKQSASRNAPLCREKPNSSKGSTDNHEDAPFSLLRSTSHCCLADRLSYMQSARAFCSFLFSECIDFLVSVNVAPTEGSLSSCEMISATAY